MAQETIIDFIEGYFGRTLDQSLAEDLYVRRVTFDPWNLAAAYSAWRQDTALPDDKTDDEYRKHAMLGGCFRPLEPVRLPAGKKAGEIRPYLAVSTRPPESAPDIGYFVFDSSEAQLWHTVDAIKHRLLYCHSLAVENPMAIWMTEPRGQVSRPILQNGVFGWHVNSHSIMSRWVAFLSHMKPLVASGAFVVVENAARDPWMLNLSEDARAKCEAAATVMGMELWEYARAAEYLELALKVRSRREASIDLDLSDARTARLAKHLLNSGEIRTPIKDGEHGTLSTLLSVELPSLDRLGIEDLVAIRRHDDKFERWRQGLEAIARKMEEEDPGGDLPPLEKAYELSRRFRAEAMHLQDELGAKVTSSPTLRSRIKPVAMKFILGAAVGGLVAWPLGLAIVPGVLVRDFVKTLAESMLDQGNSRPDLAQRALAGMFVAFEQEA